MFKLVDRHVVKWPVTIRKPIDGGKVEKHQVDVEFEILATDQYDQAAVNGEFLDRVLVGINTPVAAEGSEEPLEFETAKKLLLKIPYARAALIEAYFTASSGREAQQKN